MLDLFHTHLAQLKRDGLINTWTDRQIEAGGRIDDQIMLALQQAQLFIALLSPAYIASGYCYEQEFKKAQERETSGSMTVVPVILQPCEWLSTPFSKFKALPRDGKPIADWSNVHTAFLDVIQHLRKLLNGTKSELTKEGQLAAPQGAPSRNYRVKKDFDSIQKMEFVSKTFEEVKEYIRRYLDEVKTLDDVKTMPLTNSTTRYENLLVNRNLIKAEAKLTLTTDQENGGFSVLGGGSTQLFYSIGELNRSSQFKSFRLAWDEFHLYWADGPMAAFYGRSSVNTELSSKAIADIIFDEWLKSVGIL